MGGERSLGTTEAGFSRIFDRLRPQILAYCLRRTSTHDADDATSEVFTIAWRRRHDMPGGDQTLPWLYGVARNVVSDQWRGARRRRNLIAKATGFREPGPRGPEDVLIEHEDYRHLRAALTRLGELDREVLLLSAWEGLTYSEIAAAIGASLAAVDKRIARAKERLARQYDLVVQSSDRSSSAGRWKGDGGR